MASPSAKAPLSIPGGGGRRRFRHRETNGEDVGAKGNGDDDGDDGSEDMDPNEFDLMVSRSLQTGGPLLEPESLEHSMLRNTRRHRSRTRESEQRRLIKPHDALGVASISPQRQQQPSDETTPLLLPDPLSSKVDVVDTPYLSGVSPARFWTLFLGTLLSYFVACFDSTIMACSHPVITSYFGSSNSASWLSTSFLLTSTAFQPMVGSLSDAVGRKVPYLVTMVLFIIATLWCTLAGSMASFIVARAVCGLGAGGMMAMSSIIVSDLVPIECVSCSLQA